ncbi:MFS transporter [Streptomyces sp. C11-1]|uniref:MFS transporter n=1 Tax=Streptomyces durocortorensis TaxID=2811104 RepID=A0ABY9VZ77_9ACTN|nr:MFS transporter [Streptomyces durocortorensis]WNF29201.1 MFS transporter [Streptomyces durocortorensis]
MTGPRTGPAPKRLGLPPLSEYLPGSPAGRLFALATLTSSFGTGLFLAGATVFFTTAAGLTHVQLGAGLGIAAFVGLVATIPLGGLADRAGARNVLIGAMLWRALCFTALAFVQGPVAFTVAASCQAVAQNATGPLTQALVGGIAGDGDRVRLMAVVRTVRNIGFSLGALAATPMLLIDDIWINRGVLIGNAAAFAVSALLMLRLRAPGPVKAPAFRNPFAAFRAVRDGRYLTLAGLNSVLTLHMTLLAVGLPLWVTSHDSAPDALVPILVLVNTVLAVVLQVPFAKGVTDPRTGVRALRRAGLALAGCAAVLAVPVDTKASLAIAAALAACVLLTAGELWQAAGAWELSYTYAPEDRRNVYLSVFSLGFAVQDMAGPLLITAVVLVQGPPGWLGLAALFAVASLLPGLVVRRLKPPAAEPVSPAAVTGA